MPPPNPDRAATSVALPTSQAAVAVVIVLACAESSSNLEPELVTLAVVSWGGAYQAAMTDASLRALSRAAEKTR